MAQVQKKKTGRKKAAPVVEKDENSKLESERVQKLGTYLKTIPAAKKKFKGLPKRKRSPTSSELLSDPKYSASKEGPFGLGPLVFPRLQRFNNIDSFMTVYFVAALIHGVMYALSDLNMTLYESKFLLSNQETFIMDISDYFSSFLVAILVAHFGGRGNRSKWLAAASVLLGLESISFAFPLLKYEILSTVEETEELCIEERQKTDSCGGLKIPYRSICIYFYIFSQCLHGIAGMPIYILGVTFIFDHVPTYSAGLYLAIMDAAKMMGYTLGYTVGGKILKHKNETLDAVLHQQQSHWGIFFLFVAAISFCTSLPLFCFPTSLPGAHRLRLSKRKEPPTFDRRLKDKEIGPHWKDFLHAILCLLKNPLLLTQAICKVTESMTLKSSSYFLPKYLQTQFLLTPKFATKLTGLIVVPGSMIGHFLGGLIVDRLEMTCKNKLKFTLVTSIVSTVLFLLIFFVSCDTSQFAGINEDYDGLGRIGSLTAPCNDKCGCTTSVYSPVCGRDEKEYFSPCFAGCYAAKEIQEKKTYYNCSCISEGLTTVDREGDFVDAASGSCNTKCLSLPLFFAFYFSATVFSNLCSVPVTLVILQSVPANFNSLGLGVTYTIWRFSGSIPVPIILAVSEISSCIYWDINECGAKGHCWIFDKLKLVRAFMEIYKYIKDIMWNKGICVIRARYHQGVILQLFTSFLNIYAIHKYNYVVMGSIETVAKAVKNESKKRRKSLISN
ncbi:LOW QUALITY PROTEIN: solute carrier organic anion transporter family member 6A1-like [Grammomys surdaster]|uniref:LOW QUALITY PROTEIN: solute carrier organic anion transporter family member 6A1-like n=1 Tax=Grammomys surdaster TaxID=491861 RepID=UPI0010A02F12|nr:LOW QUALITY PROTEIN: solute carrier organic anion transporter family member 6A1-like [Grammomys surdaster]